MTTAEQCVAKHNKEFDAGYYARSEGKLLSNNPYPPLADKSIAWREGWWVHYDNFDD